VIVGRGFGGLRAAQNLRSDLVDVTLVDRRNYHLFQPLLYQVAIGSLSPGEIASPLRAVLSAQSNARVLLGRVADVDSQSKRVFLEDGATLPYDSLIIATGSQTSYFGRKEWEEWARMNLPAQPSVCASVPHRFWHHGRCQRSVRPLSLTTTRRSLRRFAAANSAPGSAWGSHLLGSKGARPREGRNLPETPITQLVGILAASIAPVIVISGVGLLLLSMTNRYSRVIDRSREITRDVETAADAARRKLWLEELRILYRRARILRRAIILSSVSILFVGVTVFSVFAAQLLKVRADYISIPSFGLSLISLIGSLYFFIRDVGISLTALELEIAPYVKSS